VALTVHVTIYIYCWICDNSYVAIQSNIFPCRNVWIDLSDPSNKTGMRNMPQVYPPSQHVILTRASANIAFILHELQKVSQKITLIG
jgi:hypothetical protein